MFRTLRSYISIVFVMVICCQTAMGQASSFVHIQSANSQPYYVQWNGNLFSSSASGYLVIPKVAVGDQTMVIGFPRNQFPEYTFKYSMTDKPKGFSLKLSIDNSWSLFDMVNFTVIKGTPATASEKAVVTKPAGGYNGTENAMATNTGGNTFLSGSAVKAESGVQKIFDRTTADGTDQVYIVNNDGVMDTVAVFIPFDVQPKPIALGNRRISSPVAEAAGFPQAPKERIVAAKMRPIMNTPFSK